MAVPERTSWSDERLNDLAAEVIVLKAMPIRVATLTEQVTGMRRDVTALDERMGRDIENLADLLRELGKRLDTTISVLGTEQAEHRGAERGAAKQVETSQRWHTRLSGWAIAVAGALGGAAGLGGLVVSVLVATHSL